MKVPILSTLSLLLVLCLSASAIERFVSPEGSFGASGTLADPLRTISEAMNIASAGDVITLHPGIYRDTIGEQFPIAVKDGVTIQGTNALNTVIFAPQSEVFWFDGNTGDFVGTMIQGLSITNARSAILMTGAPVHATIANCFIFENVTGIRMESEYTNAHLSEAVDKDQNGYTEHRPVLQSLTICRNGIGILDAGNPQPTPGGPVDPDGTVNGEALACIVNCIVFGNTLSDLEGVDAGDVASTAFFTADQFGFSKALGPIGTSAVDLSAETVDGLFIHPDRGDYRLAHYDGHPLVDVGNQFAPTANGTQLNFTFGGALDWFYDDCEGYGNDRYDGILQGVNVDIGADERGEYSIAGFFPLSTTLIGPNYLTLELRGSSKLPAPTEFSNWIAISSALGYQPYSDLGSFPGLRPRDATEPTLLPLGGVSFIPLGPPLFMTTIDLPTDPTPCTPNRFYSQDLTFAPATIAHQWMWQSLPFDRCQSPPILGELSNLQHFQFGANGVPFGAGGGLYRGPADVVPLPFGFDLRSPLEEYCEILNPECCDGESYTCDPPEQLPDVCIHNPAGQLVILERHRWTLRDLVELCDEGCLEQIVDADGNVCICIESTRPATVAYVSESPLLTNFQGLQEAVSLYVCQDGVTIHDQGPLHGTLESPWTEPCEPITICITFNLDCLCDKVQILSAYGQIWDQWLIQVDFELCAPCPPGTPVII